MKPSKILRGWPPIPWEKVPSNHHWPTSELSWNQLLQCSAALLLEIVHPWHPKNSWHEKDSCSCLSKKSSCLMTGLRTYVCHKVLCKWLICPARVLETPMSLVEWYDINWFTGLSTVYLIQNCVCVCACAWALFWIVCHQILYQSIFGGENVVPLPTSFIR